MYLVMPDLALSFLYLRSPFIFSAHIFFSFFIGGGAGRGICEIYLLCRHSGDGVLSHVLCAWQDCF